MIPPDGIGDEGTTQGGAGDACGCIRHNRPKVTYAATITPTNKRVLLAWCIVAAHQ